MTTIHHTLQRLLSDDIPEAPVRDVEDWWTRHQALGQTGVSRPLHRAALAGLAMDRLGYAFASGYHEALHFAIPELGAGRWALCATEKGGAHPRAIECTISPRADGPGFSLTGTKHYASLGTHADGFVVIASQGTGPDGRNLLVALRVPADRAGVTVESMPPTPFIPEIPHARLVFESVAIDEGERLPGDGYERYLKPFRTVEDAHVHAAFLGWLVRNARVGAWPHELIEESLIQLAGLASIVPPVPDDRLLAPATHIALAGALRGIAALVERADDHWGTLDAETRTRWQRDRPLLAIAGKARGKRREAAWRRVSAPAPG